MNPPFTLVLVFLLKALIAYCEGANVILMVPTGKLLGFLKSMPEVTGWATLLNLGEGAFKRGEGSVTERDAAQMPTRLRESLSALCLLQPYVRYNRSAGLTV